MKKRVIYLFVFIFLSFFSIGKVSAETYTCRYGTLTNGTWEKKYEFDINIQRGNTNSVSFELKKNASPEMLDIAASDDWNRKDQDTYAIYTATSWWSEGSAHVSYTVMPKLYNKRILEILFDNEPVKGSKSDDEYKESLRKHYCLTSIQKEEIISKTLSNKYSLSALFGLDISVAKANLITLHASSMTINDIKDESGIFKQFWDFLVGNDEKTKITSLIEEGSKDLDKRILDADCSTFNIYLTGIQNAAANGCDGNAEFDKRYLELVDLCNSYRQTAHYANSSNGEVKAKSCSTACSYLYAQIDKMCGKSGPGPGCGSLGHKIVSWLFKIIKFVRYAIPALLIILSILDYIKAIASDSEDEMKKVVSRFSKRLIAAALIFIIPFVLEFILNIFNLPGLNADNLFCAK